MGCRLTDVKENFKGKYKNLNCELCNEENESQLHKINCRGINKLYTLWCNVKMYRVFSNDGV